MAARLLITCRSEKVPGPDEDKTMLLANQACQKAWDREFDETQGDRLTIEGSKDYTTSFFRWNGRELVLEPLPPYALKRLEEKYQFDPANRPQRISYTDEEYKKEFGLKKYEELRRAIAEREEIVKRFGPDKS